MRSIIYSHTGDPSVLRLVDRDLTEPGPGEVRIRVIVSGSFVLLVLLNFAWFYPIYTDQLLTHREWLQRIWFTRLV